MARSLQGSSIVGLPLGAGLLLLGVGARVDFGLEAVTFIQIEHNIAIVSDTVLPSLAARVRRR